MRSARSEVAVNVRVIACWASWIPLLLAVACGESPVAAPPVEAEKTPLDANLGQSERRNIGIFREASPSTVFITSVALRRGPFSLDVTRVPQGSGSGFIWDDQGHVVTNFHVVQTKDRSTRYSVTLWDQSEWDARVIGIAPEREGDAIHAHRATAVRERDL